MATDSLPTDSCAVSLFPPSLDDTLALPSLETLLPTDTTLFYTAIPIEGEVGTPHAFSIQGDDLLTLLLLTCLIVMTFMLSVFRSFFLEKNKEFFITTHDEYDVHAASISPYLPLLLAECMVMGLGWFIFSRNQLPDSISYEPILIVLVYAAAFALYFSLKFLLYLFVNSVFFGSKKSIQWGQALLFATALEGLLILPLVVVSVYFDISLKTAIYYTCIVLFFNKILTIYKSWTIFFRQKERYLEIILYFCALEITPLLALGGIWMMIVNSLQINF